MICQFDIVILQANYILLGMKKEKLNEYQRKAWKIKREQILVRDNYTCRSCGRTKEQGAKLDVHHLRYFRNAKVHDYPDFMLITLCKRCHMEEHGEIRPSYGWVYEYCEDTMEYGSEQCEECNQDLRYVHVLHHENWGYIRVGCDCAERLTNNDLPTKYEVEVKNKAKRIQTFVDSSKWVHRKNGYFYQTKDEDIQIWDNGAYFKIIFRGMSFIDDLGYRCRDERIEKGFSSLIEAKQRAYELLHIEKSTRTIKDDDSFVLPVDSMRRIELLKNIIFECFLQEEKIIRPTYISPIKTIQAVELACNKIQKDRCDKNWNYDLVVNHLGRDNRNHQFYVKFIFDQDISQNEYSKIKQDRVNYIKIDCRALLKFERISKQLITYELFNPKSYQWYQWVSVPIYDNYFHRS